MEFLKGQMKLYKENGFVYYSINLIANGYDVNFPDKIKKQIDCKTIPIYKDVKLKAKFDSKKNCIMIPTGENYNLILVDVDNKYDTVDKFNTILRNNNIKIDTFTERTMNNGYHYYFRLNDSQIEEFKKINLKSKDGQLFNLNIDIKYTNQLSFGASFLKYEDKIYKTEIINHKSPSILPDFIFKEILKISNSTNEIQQTKQTKQIKQIKQTINIEEIKQILENLPSEYYDDRELWRNVGFSLGSTKDERLRELYYIFSSKSNKYTGEGECDKIFNDSNGEIKLNTLYEYAKKEEIIKFNQFIDESNDYEYVEFDNYIEFLNYYNCKQIKNIDNFVKEFSKYVKYAITKSIYVVKIGDNEFDLVKTSCFESNLSKYSIKTIEYKKGKKVILKRKMNTIINENIQYFTIHDIVFKPNQNNDKWFNLFKGFKTTKLEKYDLEIINPILQHIREVWATDSEELYNYIIYWIASILQHPEIKNYTALVLISTEGAGKNIIFDFLKKYIFGTYGVNIADIEKVVGKFNSMITNKLLTVLNEANQVEGNYNKAWEIMKNLITENKQIIERKGIDPIEVDDYNNYIFFSNNANPVKISGNDRRYFVNTCSNKYVGNTEYFRKLTESLNGDCANHLYTYLLSLDLSNVDLKKIPNTSTRTDQIVNSMSSFNKWLYENAYYNEENIEDKNIPVNDMYEIYKEQCKRDNFIILNRLTFSKELNKILDNKILKDKDRKSYRVFVYDIEKIKSYFKKININLEN